MEIKEINSYNDELQKAWNQLIPQLNSELVLPDQQSSEAIINNENSFLLGAFDGNDIVGLLTLVIYKVPSGTKGWIEDVVVDESQRGKGIGKALMNAAIDKSKNLQIDNLNLTSSPFREAANKLYQTLGFKQRETNVYVIKF